MRAEEAGRQRPRIPARQREHDSQRDREGKGSVEPAWAPEREGDRERRGQREQRGAQHAVEVEPEQQEMPADERAEQRAHRVPRIQPAGHAAHFAVPSLQLMEQ